MNSINLFSRFIVTITITLFLSAFVSAQSESNGIKQKQEAEKIWEALIRAKGGREKLHSISSILFTSYLKDKKSAGPWWQELHVLPDKGWQTGYHLDGRLTTSRIIGSTQEWANPDGTGDSYTSEGHSLSGYSLDRVVYLLETKYEKPTPLVVFRRKIGRVNYDVLEASLKKEKIHFYFDPEILLISRVILFFDDMTPWETYDFFDYKELDGIKMPQTQTFNKGRKTPIGVAFNVDYEPDLFKGPLKSAPLDGWKRKSQ